MGTGAMVESDAQHLMTSLVMAVPGDLGLIVRAIVGVQPQTIERQAAESTYYQVLDQAGYITPWEAARKYDPGFNIRPPAKPVCWASSMLALCCRIYGQPVERAVPVGACLELLGITSSSLDAVQDRHNDLLDVYDPPDSPDSLVIADMGSLLTDSTETDPHYEQRTRQRSAALISNASVAVIGLAWRALLEHGPRYGIESPIILEIGQLIAERLVKACEAQHRDLTVGRAASLDLVQYEQIIEGKTGQIDGTVCEIGAVLAHAGHHQSLWQALGTERAIALQLYDDYRDFADDILNGRQVGHPVLYGLAVAGPAQKEHILALLKQARSRAPGASEALHDLTALLRELGSDYYTLASMVKHRNRALTALEAMHLPSEAHESLNKWVLRATPQLD